MSVFHVELRQFPHNSCRFNLTEAELCATILEPWTRARWIEFGERKWNPDEARLTVLEGPELAVSQLTMGRGWRNAERQGREVTERMLAAARQATSAGPAAEAAPVEPRLLADSLGLALLADLGSEPAPLHRAWELAEARHPGRLASESLAIAELAVGSLLRAGLIVLLEDPDAQDGVSPSAPEASHGEERLLAALSDSASWAGEPGAGRLCIRRS